MAVTKIRGNTQIMDLTIENGQVATAAAIELSKLADGTKIMLDDSAQLQAALDANSNKITNLTDGSADSDAVNYGQLQQIATQGKLWSEVIFTADQLVNGAAGGIYGAQVIALSSQPGAGDTITINDGSSSENYIAGTDFSIGADIDATLSNLSTAINAGAIAVSSTTGSLDSIDATNDILVLWQDTIGEPTRVYGNAGAAGVAKIADPTMDNLYEAKSADMVALPTADPAATNFGLKKAIGELTANETHMARTDDSSYTWDGDAQIWNQTGATSIPYASKSIYGKVMIENGLNVSSGLISVDAVANEGLAVSAAGVQVDYDSATIGMVTNKLAVLTDGIDETHIDWGTGAGQVSQDDVVDGTTYKRFDPAAVDINGGTIDGVSIGTSDVVTQLNVDNIQVDGNTISSTDANGDINLTPNGTGEVNITKVDIDDGTIDGVDITVGAATTLDVSAGTLTLADDQISGDKVEGGTINAITVNTLTVGTSIEGGMIGASTPMTQINVDNIRLDGNTISSTNANGGVTIAPNGSGAITLSNTIVATGAIKDEDDLVSDSDVHLATQQSIKAYVDAATSGVQFSNFAVSGGNTCIADTKDDTLTFVAGQDITIVADAGSDSITISSSGSSTLTASLGVERVTNDFRLDLIASGGLKLVGNEVGVEPTDFIDTDYGLIDNNDDIRINLESDGGLQFDSSNKGIEIDIRANEGLSTTSDGLGTVIEANKGLAVGASGFATVINTAAGISVDGSGLAVNLESDAGIEFDGVNGGLELKLRANEGLSKTASGLGTVIEANKGLTVGASGLATVINTAAGMGVDGSGLKVVLEADAGIQFDAGNGGLELKFDGTTLESSASGLKMKDLTQDFVLTGNASNSPVATRNVVREAPNEAADDARVAFTVDYTPVAGTEMVFLNGILQNAGGGNDYTLSTDTITFGTAPKTGDVILVNYLSR